MPTMGAEGGTSIPGSGGMGGSCASVYVYVDCVNQEYRALDVSVRKEMRNKVRKGMGAERLHA
eukprot:1161360-Pelagomonas_calceolata.AAC.5